MDNKKNGIPKLRFPGFTGAWEQRKLGDFIIEFHEKTTVNDQYPILTSSRKGIFLQTDYYSGNQIASKDNTGYNIVPFGYFTYRHMSDDNIFRFNINKIVDKGIVSTLYPVFTTNKYLDSRYLQIQLNHGNEFAKYALLQKQGGSRTYMYLSKLKKLVLTMPKSTSEQKTISNFFDTLDSLITLHQRKLEHLQEQKKGLLQKMFPKNGEVVPEVRFPGFTDAWEQRKLGEVAHIETGKLDANAMVENGKYDFYTSGIKKYRIDIPAFKGPAITIAGNGATVGYMHLADGEFNAYQRTYVLTKFLANRHFIFSEIGNKLPRKIQQESRAGNIPYIVMDMLTDLQLFLPSIAEQEKVGELLNKLNSLITLHQRKLEHLELMKKGLLQQMFV